MSPPKQSNGASGNPNNTIYMSAQYQVIPAYQGPNDTGSTQFIYVLPPTQVKSQGFSSCYGQSFPVVIQDVNGPFATSNNPPPPPSGDIVLSWVDSAQAQSLVLNAQIPAYVWNTGTQDRQNLATAFTTLLKQLEAMEDNGQLTRGSARYVTQRIVDGLPLSLSEALLYRYGFNASAGYADVVPGMRLRIEYGSFQSIGPAQPLNSFTGSGVGYYDISAFLKQAKGKFADTVAFNSYLATNRVPSIAPTTSGASSIIDVQSKNGPRRYYRLFYPKTFISPTYSGNPGMGENVTLVGADTWEQILSLTEEYESDQRVFPNANIDAVYFGGRAVLIPEILMFMNSNPIYVPIGTTVRNVVERVGHFSFATMNPNYQDFFLTRQYYQMNPQAPLSVANYLSLNFVQLNNFAQYVGPDVYQLPVIIGDKLSVNP